MVSVVGWTTASTALRFLAAADGTGTGGRAVVGLSGTANNSIGGITTMYAGAVLKDIPLITSQTIYVETVAGGSFNGLNVVDYTI
jgi:hypothetical protein